MTAVGPTAWGDMSRAPRWRVAVLLTVSLGGVATACSSPADELGEVVEAELVRIDVDADGPVRVTALDSDTLILESLPPLEVTGEELLRGNRYFEVDPSTGEARRIDISPALDAACDKPAGFAVGRSPDPGVFVTEIDCLRPEDLINLAEIDVATGELLSLTQLSQGVPQAPVVRIELLDDTRYLVTVGGICNSLGIVDTTTTGVTAAQLQGLSELDWNLSQGFQQVFCNTRLGGAFDDVAVAPNGSDVAVLTVDFTPEGPSENLRALWTGTTTEEGFLSFEGPIEGFYDAFAVDFVGDCVVVGDTGPDTKLVALAPNDNIVIRIDTDRRPSDLTRIPSTSLIAMVTDTGDKTILHVIDLEPWCST